MFDTYCCKSLGLPRPPSSQFWSSEMFHNSTLCSKLLDHSSSCVFHTVSDGSVSLYQCLANVVI